MNAAKWKEVQNLFQRATQWPSADRDSLLSEACAGNEELRDEVESLLAFDHPGELTMVAGHSAPEEEAVGGRRIGAYRLLREIGRGGMSVVYLAVRDDRHFERRVALKVIRPGFGFGHQEMMQRFRQERQILASLDHPNIAHLLDGGSTEDGLPYFVMEYIEGMPIDRYCAAHGLSVPQRLRLLQTVCRAVHHAHQNLVVHRDLKPSNVLVTSSGEPKLLDFGIAKLLNPQLTRAEVVSTTPSLQLMTAGYASPEQILGEPISTASDVYSLGVLLYELLAGRTPFSLEGLAPGEVARLVGETTPMPPSQRSRRGRETNNPSTPSAPPPLRLHRDLDAIALMALRKEPNRRYGSALQMSEDLARFLDRRPVCARPETVVYRLGKWIQRNRLAAVLAVAGMLFALGMTAQAIRASRALAQAETQRIIAERERGRAYGSERSRDLIEQLLMQLFLQGDPDHRTSSPITARDILERNLRNTERHMADQPLAQADVYDLAGRLYQELGMYDQSGPLLERAYALRQAQLPVAHPHLADSLHHLANHHYLQGEFARAEREERQALEIRAGYFGEKSLEVAESLQQLGAYLLVQERTEEAETRLLRSLELHRALLPSADPRIAGALNTLSYFYYWTDDLQAAKVAGTQAVALLTEHFDADHPEVAEALSTLSLVLAKEGNFAEAEDLLARVLDIWREAYPDSHASVAGALNDFGSLLTASGEAPRAESYLRDAVEVYREINGGQVSMLGTSLSNLAFSLFRQGKLEEAREVYQEAQEAFAKTLGTDNTSYATTLTMLAEVYRKLGEAAQAVTLHRRALRIRRAVLAPGERAIAESAFALGRVLNELRQPAESEPLLRESAAAYRAGGDGTWAANCEIELAKALKALERPQEALPLAIAAVGALEGLPGSWAKRAQQAAELAEELSSAQ